eukprot:GHVU01122150.1.p1 GENE.GHVU01122150.1~~GHVU01122150.1.p1  ORF type:complete len:397 (-),score=57.26 GHVU01122150.1:270-1460(-)
MAAAPRCAICHYRQTKKLCTLPCGHVFHRRCVHSIQINDLIGLRRPCPVCRTPFDTSGVRWLHFELEPASIADMRLESEPPSDEEQPGSTSSSLDSRLRSSANRLEAANGAAAASTTTTAAAAAANHRGLDRRPVPPLRYLPNAATGDVPRGTAVSNRTRSPMAETPRPAAAAVSSRHAQNPRTNVGASGGLQQPTTATTTTATVQQQQLTTAAPPSTPSGLSAAAIPAASTAAASASPPEAPASARPASAHHRAATSAAAAVSTLGVAAPTTAAASVDVAHGAAATTTTTNTTRVSNTAATGTPNSANAPDLTPSGTLTVGNVTGTYSVSAANEVFTPRWSMLGRTRTERRRRLSVVRRWPEPRRRSAPPSTTPAGWSLATAAKCRTGCQTESEL